MNNIDLARTLRQRGLLAARDTYREKYKLAKQIIRSHQHKVENPKRISDQFTNEQIAAFSSKRLHIIEVREKQFKRAVLQFLEQLQEKVLANLRAVKSAKQDVGDIFDDEEQQSKAVDMLAPIILAVVAAAGGNAAQLVKRGMAYVPSSDIVQLISDQVSKFAGEMLATDKAKLTAIITSGFEEGFSIPKVSDDIKYFFQDQVFAHQPELVARTELLRASQYGALDAWRQSGVVAAEQWAVDGDPCEACAEMDGEVIGLEDNWDSLVGAISGSDSASNLASSVLDYGTVDGPPLHPNCECTLIPIMISDTENAAGNTVQVSKDYLAELERIAGVDHE